MVLYILNLDSSYSFVKIKRITFGEAKRYYIRTLELNVSNVFLSDTMMKFASFETVVEIIYKHAIPKPKNECSKNLQLGVSFAGGYIAGVLCAVVSHPADNLVSFLNNAKGATVGDAVKKLGWFGLFTRGLPLRIVMIGTLTGAQWGIYDAFKVFVGLPTTGGVAPVAVPSPAPPTELAQAESS